ncbi:hypothetical protein D910_12648 [Dendroctonus ponderosae]|uniref:Tc1-like transposase DDE domain-containing protein n=1 Tax=Dendroctonus ponderosae TaxID=77166 RepID=U4UMT9_DENPD|nr:hypothetical protein D910_12648 [Dendroctonus ponderosae]
MSLGRNLFGREHVDWDLDDWKKVLFTDERRPGERYSQACLVPQVAFRGDISLEARTDLVVIRGRSLTSQKYIQDILENHVVLLAPLVGDNLLFMDDNARPHQVVIPREYLNEVNVIGHVWDQLKPKPIDDEILLLRT